MHIDRVADIEDSYAHVYLSPHLDDAALSCGGAIARQVAAGERVLVVNICTAAPAPDEAFSALAQEFHGEWRLSPAEVVAARLREDRAALDRLGADSLHAGMLDAIYRHPAAYSTRETLFGEPDPADPLLPALETFIASLRRQAPRAWFYAPLGVGSHVDHQITQRAALASAGGRLAFYEDFPYVARPGALEQRLRALDGSFQAETIAIDETLPAKVAAVSAYASQHAELAHSQLGQQVTAADALAAIVASITNYAGAVRPDGADYGERFWLPGVPERGMVFGRFLRVKLP